ncbi:hypothetical protein B0H13DRAFT_2359349 [Mycena leptocephala]|nr:hypothetical protein B0H13DRAFT_2359349 [Mycena leptocephala]
MLFPAFRVMNPELWKSIPETTNAEEAMHSKIYAAIGRLLSLLDGLKALYRFAVHYQELSDAASHGIKVFYGRDRQPWKLAAEKLGYTKFSRRRAALRASKHTNDGRPPDTGKALLGKGSRPRKPEYEKSYPWKDNSCWLDSSLTLLSVAASRDSDAVDTMFADLPAGHPLRDLRQMMHTRLNSVNFTEYALLKNGRDGFRQILCKTANTPIKTMTGFNTMFGWLYHISGRRVPHAPESGPSVERARAYFAMSRMLFKTCVGSSNEHHQVSPVRLRNICQLHEDLCRRYDSNLRKWFQDVIRVSKSEPLDACWHARDGNVFCEGNATEFDVVLNIPTVLIIEIGDIQTSTWNIPSSLSPYASNPAASNSGVEYTIVGHIYCNKEAKHFIARYLSQNETKIFDYDGMKHEGHAIRNSAKAMRGTLTGPSRSMLGIPAGYHLYAVMYHLVGGEPAQRFFRKQQIADAEKLGLRFDIDPTSKTDIPSSCRLVRPRVEQIPADDRFWLSAPLADPNTDYILPEAEPSPRKTRGGKASPKKVNPARPRPEIIDLEADDHTEIDALLLNSPPAKRRTKTSTSSRPPNKAQNVSLRSVSPSPVWCQGCGAQEPGGDEDDNEVQCQVCKYWAHINCLAKIRHEEDWDDPEVKFILAFPRQKGRVWRTQVGLLMGVMAMVGIGETNASADRVLI